MGLFNFFDKRFGRDPYFGGIGEDQRRSAFNQSMLGAGASLLGGDMGNPLGNIANALVGLTGGYQGQLARGADEAREREELEYKKRMRDMEMEMLLRDIEEGKEDRSYKLSEREYQKRMREQAGQEAKREYSSETSSRFDLHQKVDSDKTISPRERSYYHHLIESGKGDQVVEKILAPERTVSNQVRNVGGKVISVNPKTGKVDVLYEAEKEEEQGDTSVFDVLKMLNSENQKNAKWQAENQFASEEEKSLHPVASMEELVEQATYIRSLLGGGKTSPGVSEQDRPEWANSLPPELESLVQAALANGATWEEILGTKNIQAYLVETRQ